MTGNSTFDKILALICLIVTMATTGLFVYTEFVYKKPMPNDEVEMAKMKADSEKFNFPITTKFDKLIINLQSRTRRLRFLELETNFVTYKESGRQALNENKPVVNDIVIRLANEMPPEELNTISGKILFENRLKKALNNHFSAQVIKEIHFSRFIIQ